MKPALRILLELVGAAACVSAAGAAAVLLLQFGLGALITWAATLAAGLVLALIAALLIGRARLSLRLRVDLWLCAWIPAAAMTAWMLVGRWPIRGPSSNAHGWGVSGGETNVLLLPIVQAVIFTAALLVCVRRARNAGIRALESAS